MKNFRFSAFICAAAISATLFAGCSSVTEEETSSQTSSGASSQTDMAESMAEVLEEQQINTETRPIADGDDYAINKINNKTSGDTLPGGYSLQDYTEEQQGKLYTNGNSRVIIRAYNYKEDLQAMDVWADNACAILKISNITAAQDTVFEDPENVKVCGFDGIKYDYQIIQYDFVAPEDDPDGEPVKTELYRFNARAYFFYSEQDAYIIMFDTREEDWDTESENFEKFVADLEVTKTEY